ncbi:MAG: DNA/RNA non-specific endonuclease [Bifidobacterium sp.]|nr:DNA/RNA non-specific endonuclease [Bifidobacterium sp.]
MRAKSLFTRAAAVLSAVALSLSLGACGASRAGDVTVSQSTAAAGSGDTTTAEFGSYTASNVGSLDWTMQKAPNYYEVIGKASVDKTLPKGTVKNAEVDSLGRAGVAEATVTQKMREEGSERDRNMQDPAGWPKSNPKVYITLDTGKKYHGNFWNRSHEIAKSLGGADTADNMVIGTRMQNVGDNNPAGGMAYTETLARDWLDKHKDGVVYYNVTPIYEDNDMVPKVSIVNILTSDDSIDQCVKVYNAANGYTIDYANATFTKN